MTFKTLCAAALATTALAAMAKTSTPAGWTDDYDAALKQAADENKLIIADFSGSDWCGWCQKLDEEVFSKEAFLQGVAEKYVLLFIDTPNDPSLLSKKASEQNPELVKKYAINGFPSVLVLDAKGEVIARTGYLQGGPENYVKKLEKLIATETDPEYAKYIKPLKEQTQLAKKTFEGSVSQAQRAATLKALAENLPALKKSLADAEAVEVPENLAADKKKIVGALAEMVEDVEEYLKERTKE